MDDDNLDELLGLDRNDDSIIPLFNEIAFSRSPFNSKGKKKPDKMS